jgi:alpha-D-ribose 1-methylphosphonate 5-triphosphate synthase subunit PhnL
MSMRLRIGNILALVLPLLLGSCIGEDFFGKSDFKQILFFSVPQQSGQARIDHDSLIVRLSVAASAQLDALYADSIQLSTFATVFPQVGDVRDFGQPVPYTVTAENGTTAVYTVYADGNRPRPSWRIPDSTTGIRPPARTTRSPAPALRRSGPPVMPAW